MSSNSFLERSGYKKEFQRSDMYFYTSHFIFIVQLSAVKFGYLVWKFATSVHCFSAVFRLVIDPDSVKLPILLKEIQTI